MINIRSIKADRFADAMLQHRGLAICAVYEDTPPLALLELIELGPREYFVGIRLAEQSADSRAHFETPGLFECMARGWPEGSKFPLPYLFTCVPGVGLCGIAVSKEEIPSMLARSRKEEKEVGSAREIARVSELAKHAKERKKSPVPQDPPPNKP
jgi:hypothetical protein